MKKSEVVAVLLGLLVAIMTSASGGYILAGVLIGSACTSALQRSNREIDNQIDQIAEWHAARYDEGETR